MSEVLENVEQKDQGLNYFNSLDIETGKLTTEVLDKKAVLEILSGRRPELFSLKDLKVLGQIEKEAFPEELAEEPEDLIAEFEEGWTGGYLFFAFREKGKLVGYLLAKPAPKALGDFMKWGTPVEVLIPKNDNLYLKSIAGKIGIWGRKIFQIIEKQAKNLGYKKLSGYAVNPRLSRILQKSGFEVKRVIPNWLGVRAEYIEKKL